MQIGKYKHFKGNYYEVIGVGKHSETLEEFVIYRQLYGNNEIWIRPRKNFEESVIIDCVKIQRFEYIC